MTAITLKYMGLFLAGMATIGIVFFCLERLGGLFFTNLCNRFPQFIKEYIRKRREKKIGEQLVDGVCMLANCLKAGLSLQQAFLMLSKDGPSPLKEDMFAVVGRIKSGESLENSLVEWRNKTRIDDVEILVESILILRQTGGNLVETFSIIAETIRERQKVSGKIGVLTAQGVLQAVIILLLPPALITGLYFVASWYIGPLFTTPLGWLLLLVALGLQVVGAIWLKKIVTIRV